MKFKYVYLGYGSDYFIRYNSEMAKHCKNVFNILPLWLRLKGILWLLYRIHMSGKVNKIFRLPYKTLWLRWLLDSETKKQIRRDDRIIFDISVWFIYCFGLKELCMFLRQNYPKCKIVTFFSDTVKLHQHCIQGFNLNEVKEVYDAVIAYNKFDAEKYGLQYAPTVLRNYDDINAKDLSPVDVVFIGQDKGRLNQIYDIYEKCTAYGLKCDFHLAGIEPSRQKHKDKISFGGYIPYEEVLRRSKAAKCILNIVQPGAKGITPRDYESIGMNKLLMTNGQALRESDLYTEEKVIWLDNLENELWKFDKFDASREWNNKDKHTPEKYFEWIEGILNDQVKK